MLLTAAGMSSPDPLRGSFPESSQKENRAPQKYSDRRRALLRIAAGLHSARWSLALDVFLFAAFTQPPQPFIDPCERLARLFHSFPGEIERRAIMHAHQRVTNFAAAVSFRQHIAQSVEIA